MFNIKSARYICHKIGRIGEDAACQTITAYGWDILCRNYCTGRRELDIVARHDAILHFIEVKTRRYKPNVFPVTAVNWQKRINIILAARQYLREIGRPKLHYQYDIIEVLVKDMKPISVNILTNMFSDKKISRQFS